MRNSTNLKKTHNEALAIKAETTEAKKAERAFLEEWKMAGGPFGPIHQQPLVKALLFVLAGLGIGFMEPLLKMVGF